MTLATLPLLTHLPWLAVAPALLVGVGLLVATRLSKRVAVVPAIIVGGIAVFYMGLHASGLSIDDARRAGLLFGPEPIRDLRLPVTQLREVWFAPILSRATEIFAVAAVTAMTMLLNATSIGVTTSRDVDFNRELRAAGVANLLAGLLGGIAGCQSMSRTMMNWRMGATTRRAGVLAALMCLLLIGGLPDVIALFPKAVMIGLQLYLGGAVLIEWLLYAYKRLPWHDYLLIPAIMLIIAGYGIVAGVVLGVVAACLLFVVRYGRVNCIRAEFNGSSQRSRVERTIEQNRLLEQQARYLYGIGLQGFLFFGTAYSILTHIRARIETKGAHRPPDAPAVRYVLVDFGRVHGVDASSTASFVRLRQACAREGAQLVLTGLPPALHEWFRKGGILTQGAHEFASLDIGLEWIEDQMLANAQDAPASLADNSPIANLPDALGALRPHFERITLRAGECLFRQMDPGDAVYFVDSGRVTVALTLADGGSIRLRSFGAGTIVGEMAIYTGSRRSADVVADVPTIVERLTLATLKRLETDDPVLAAQFHAFVVRVLAARLVVANEQIRAAAY
jgi:SulP family sulfate permease